MLVDEKKLMKMTRQALMHSDTSSNFNWNGPECIDPEWIRSTRAIGSILDPSIRLPRTDRIYSRNRSIRNCSN